MGEQTLTPETTLGELLEQRAAESPDREALVFGERRITYGQLNDHVNALVAQFEQLGIKKGDRVATILPSLPELVYVALAAAKTGAIMTTINPMLPAGGLEFHLKDSGASLVVALPQLMKRNMVAEIQTMRPNLPDLRHVAFLGPPMEGALSLHAMLAVPPAPRDSFVAEGLSPHDITNIFYTGGTTGLPKGAMASPYKILYPEATTGEEWSGLTEDDVLLVIAPLFLTAGFLMLAPMLLYGMKMVGMAAFDPRAILQTIQDEKATYFMSYPTMMRMIMALPDFGDFDVSSTRLIALGGEPVTADLVEAVQSAFTCTTITGYGSTEVNPITRTKLGDAAELQATSDGVVLPGLEMKLVDENREEVPFGEVGEVVVRGPVVLKGYWNRPEVSAQAIDEDGWFYTADLVRYINEEGYIRFVGRQKDTIRRGGMTIYPEEVENYLKTHPKIMNAGVVGVPSDIGWEKARAYVQLMPGAEMTPAEVVDFCRHQLASYKIPSDVRFVENLPLSPVRKVLRYKLREMAQSDG